MFEDLGPWPIDPDAPAFSPYRTEAIGLGVRMGFSYRAISSLASAHDRDVLGRIVIGTQSENSGCGVGLSTYGGPHEPSYKRRTGR